LQNLHLTPYFNSLHISWQMKTDDEVKMNYSHKYIRFLGLGFQLSVWFSGAFLLARFWPIQNGVPLDGIGLWAGAALAWGMVLFLGTKMLLPPGLHISGWIKAILSSWAWGALSILGLTLLVFFLLAETPSEVLQAFFLFLFGFSVMCAAVDYFFSVRLKELAEKWRPLLLTASLFAIFGIRVWLESQMPYVLRAYRILDYWGPVQLGWLTLVALPLAILAMIGLLIFHKRIGKQTVWLLGVGVLLLGQPVWGQQGGWVAPTLFQVYFPVWGKDVSLALNLLSALIFALLIWMRTYEGRILVKASAPWRLSLFERLDPQSVFLPKPLARSQPVVVLTPVRSTHWEKAVLRTATSGNLPKRSRTSRKKSLTSVAAN
jgi:hypothetical protein